MIRLEDITVAYDDRIILNHVNLDIHDGETLAVIGASGSGKSTTLRLIMGLQKPTSGRVYIDGEDITDYSEEKMDEVRRHMGMVFQYSALFDSMTVGENVAFGLRQHTKTKEEEIVVLQINFGKGKQMVLIRSYRILFLSIPCEHKSPC